LTDTGVYVHQIHADNDMWLNNSGTAVGTEFYVGMAVMLTDYQGRQAWIQRTLTRIGGSWHRQAKIF
jgi:hypothetical protein